MAVVVAEAVVVVAPDMSTEMVRGACSIPDAARTAVVDAWGGGASAVRNEDAHGAEAVPTPWCTLADETDETDENEEGAVGDFPVLRWVQERGLVLER